MAGEIVDCNMGGRRMMNPHAFAKKGLEETTQEMKAWGVEFCGGSWPLFAEAQGAVRALHLMGLRYIRYLTRIPYLFCRLNQPGVRDECKRQFALAPAESHHRVSRAFIEEGTSLSAAFHSMNADGTGMSPELEAERNSIAMLSLDDNVAEKPHGGVKREHEHSPAASWEWIAATMKLLQNLYDVRLLVARLGLDLQSEWR